MASTSSPAHTRSSSERAPATPHCAAAAALTSPATPTAAAPRQARSARVPLLVVNTMVRPPTRSRVISRGEFPRSKPGMVLPRRSPASTTPLSRWAAMRRRASTASATGSMARAPLASAVTIVVLARSTSTTRTVASVRRAGTTTSAVTATSRRTALPRLPVPEGANAQTQGVEVDEALRVALTIDVVALEGGEVLAVERAGRPTARHGGVALVETQAHRAGDVALAVVHEALEGLALGREPEA